MLYVEKLTKSDEFIIYPLLNSKVDSPENEEQKVEFEIPANFLEQAKSNFEKEYGLDATSLLIEDLNENSI